MINTQNLLSNTIGTPVAVSTASTAVAIPAPTAIPGDPLQILSWGSKEFSRATTDLAVSMMTHHEALHDFLGELRRAASSPSREFRYSMERLSEEQKEQVVCHLGRMVGLLINVFHNRAAGVISGKISDIPACIEFVKGGYLELAIETITRREVDRFCQEHGLEGQVRRNVVVTDGQAKNELDILLEIGGTKMFIEVKSGTCTDFQKYYFIGKRYGLIPDRILLVSAQLSDDQCCQLHDFLEYYTANLDSFTERLNNMLTTNLGGIDHE